MSTINEAEALKRLGFDDRAVVAFADTGDTRPWHAFSRERLA